MEVLPGGFDGRCVAVDGRDGVDIVAPKPTTINGSALDAALHGRVWGSTDERRESVTFVLGVPYDPTCIETVVGIVVLLEAEFGREGRDCRIEPTLDGR